MSPNKAAASGLRTPEWASACFFASDGGLQLLNAFVGSDGLETTVRSDFRFFMYCGKIVSVLQLVIRLSLKRTIEQLSKRRGGNGLH